jgi:L-threonylcarbamoyladenylate synthase
MPDHDVALRLIERAGQPLAAPSANLSGRPSPTCAFDAWEDLQGKVELILDGGPCRIGIESTVLSLAHPVPTLLRPGQIAKEEIEEILGEEISLPSLDGPILSPGMKYRHYAPNARVRLFFNRSEIRGPFVLSPDPKPGERLLSAHTFYAALREADRLGVPEIEVDCGPSVQANEALMNRLLRASPSLDFNPSFS